MNKLLSVVLATMLVLFGTVVPVSAETVIGADTTSRLAGQTSVAIAEAYNNNVSDEPMHQVSNISSSVTNINTPQEATDTDNTAVMEKQQKAGPSRIASGGDTAYYLDSSGHVWAWGDGARDELGIGTKGTQLNPSDTVNPVYGSSVPVEVPNLSNIVSIAAGGNTCYALDNGGHVWAWGDGTYGQLGNDMMATGNVFQNFYGSTVPVEVSKLSSIVSIAAGVSTGYALDSSGHVWAWGQGSGGQLGNQDGPTSSDIPIQISTLTDIGSISADAQGGEVFAFSSSGVVWAWGPFGSGIDASGLLKLSIQAPVQLSNLKNIVAIAYEGFGDKGIWHASNGNAWGIKSADQLWYALDSSGQVWAWEFTGWQAGDGIKITPVNVSNFSNIVAIVGRGGNSYNSGYALDSSGHVLAWGDGTDNVFGNDGTVTKKSTPVQVSNISNIVGIAGNNINCYALDNSGKVWAWGLNNSGQLGNGTINNSSVPVQVLGLPK